jgi:uncharacterized protein
MTLVLSLITAQVILGAFDELWHHEIVERLPAKRAAATELTLHAIREVLYAYVFFALAWFEWHGAWALVLAAVLLIEIGVTLADFVVEDRTRRLPAFERILHTVLAINIGIVLTVFAPILFGWWLQPTAVVATSHGVLSWLFTVFAVGVFAWSVRNTIAVLRHRRPQEWVRNPISAGKSATPRAVLITGATGFVGGHVVRRLVARGDEVIVLTRDEDKALNRFGPHARIVSSLDAISSDTRIDAVINLAGAPILGMPWTRARRRKLLASRLDVTRELVQLSARLTKAPRVLVNASAIGYYGVRGEEWLDEGADPQDSFQSQLCQQWECTAVAAESLGTRVVRLRFGLVLGRDGGALPQFMRPARFGLGAVLGSGRQWVSWIHIDDLVRLIEFALEKPALRGAVNAVAPKPATHLQLQRAITGALHRPLWFRVPAFVLRFAMGEMAQLLVDGQKVIPSRAVALGFVFRHPHLREAIADLSGPAISLEPADFYFNGECPVCNFEMSRYQKHCETTATPMRFVDAMRHPESLQQYGLRTEHLERRVYMRDPNGRILSGLPALIELWARMPGYGWLSKLLSLPGLRQVSVVIYDQALAPSLAWWARLRMRQRELASVEK